MALAEDLEEQVIELELKRDCYVRLAEGADCSQLRSRYLQTTEELSGRIEELFRALAATPQRRGTAPKSEGPLQEVELLTEEPLAAEQGVELEVTDDPAFEDQVTRVWRRSRVTNRFRAPVFAPPFVKMPRVASR